MVAKQASHVPEPLPVEYRPLKSSLRRIRRQRKSLEQPVYVRVELYRGTYNQGQSLEKYLRDYEAVDHIGRVARKASGAVEVGHLFYVYVLPVLVRYAGNKGCRGPREAVVQRTRHKRPIHYAWIVYAEAKAQDWQGPSATLFLGSDITGSRS